MDKQAATEATYAERGDHDKVDVPQSPESSRGAGGGNVADGRASERTASHVFLPGYYLG